MALTVGELTAKIRLDDSGVEKGLDTTKRGMQSVETKAGDAEGASRRLGGALGDVAKIAGGFIVAKGLQSLGGIMTGAVSGAVDLEESQNKVNVVFGDSAKAINDFAANSTRALGLSEQATLAATGTFGNMFTSMGLGQKEAAGLSKEVLTLGADLGSFNNISSDEALEKLRAGLVGEAEPLRALGINLNAAAVDAKAMEMGLADANGELSESAKVQARYALIVEQTKNAQGDFARTSDGVANSQKIIGATFSDLATTIGSKVLPAITPLVVGFAEKLPGAIDATGKMFTTHLQPILERVAGFVTGTALPAIKGLATQGAELFTGTLLPAVNGFIDGALPRLQDFTDWITETALPAVRDFATMAADFFTGTILPAVEGFIDAALPKLQSLGDWFTGTALPAVSDFATQAAGFFTGTLLPAVNTFIDTAIPKLQELGTWLLDTAIPAVREFAGTVAEYVTNNIMPAFQRFAADVLPGLKSVGAFVVDTVIPAIRDLASALADRIPGAIDSIVGGWQSFVKAAEPVVNLLRGNMDAVLIGVGAILVAVIIPAIVAWTTATVASAAAHITAAIAWAAAYLPIIAILAAVGVAAALLYKAWDTNFLGIQDITKSVIDFVRPYIETAIGGIQSFFETAWPIISGAVQTAWSLIQGAIETAIGIVKPAAETFVGGVRTLFETVWPIISGAVETAWAAISTAVDTINAIKTTIETVLGTIKTKWDEIWDGIKTKVQDIWDGASGVFSTVKGSIESVKTFLGNIMTDITEAWGTAWDGVKGTVTGIWTEIAGAVKTGINEVIGYINSFISAFNGMTIAVPEVDIPLVGKQGGWSVGMPQIPAIPELMRGGLTTGPTMAMLHDNEIVLPLASHGINALADAMVKAGGQRGGDTHVHVEIGGREVERFVINAVNGHARRSY